MKKLYNIGFIWFITLLFTMNPILMTSATNLKDDPYIRYSKGLLSLRLNEAGLIDVLNRISEKTKIDFRVNGNTNQRVTFTCHKMKVEAAVVALIKNVANYSFQFSAKDELSRVIILFNNDALPVENEIDRDEDLGLANSKLDEHEIENLLSTSIYDLVKSKNPALRIKALELLGDIDSIQSFEIVSSFLDDTNSEIRIAAVEALTEMDDQQTLLVPLTKALSDPVSDVRVAVVEAIGDIDDELALDLLPKVLLDESVDVRTAAVEILTDLDDERVIEPLILALQDENDEIRIAAIDALSEYEDDRILEPLVGTLNSENSELKVNAIETLAEIGDPRALEPLLETLNDVDVSVRLATLDALGELDDDEAVSQIIDTTNDEEPEVRARAIDILSEIDVEESALKIFIESLNDESAIVRASAVDALGEIGEEDVASYLEPLLLDMDEDVRITAQEALDELIGEDE